MLYSIEIAVPINTTKGDPLVVMIPVVEGMVKRVWVRWRWGSANLCGCRLFRGGSQMWPRTLGQWFISSPYPLTFEEAYPVTAEPLGFKVEAYNLDDSYPHTVWIALSVLREEINANVREFGEFLIRGGV